MLSWLLVGHQLRRINSWSCVNCRPFYIVLGVVLTLAAATFAAAVSCRLRAGRGPRRPSVASVMALKDRLPPQKPLRRAGSNDPPDPEEGADQQLISLERGARLAQALAEAYDRRHAPDLSYRGMEVSPLEDSPPESRGSLAEPMGTAGSGVPEYQISRHGGMGHGSGDLEAAVSRPSNALGMLPGEGPLSASGRLPTALAQAVKASLLAAQQAEEEAERHLAEQHSSAYGSGLRYGRS